MKVYRDRKSRLRKSRSQFQTFPPGDGVNTALPCRTDIHLQRKSPSLWFPGSRELIRRTTWTGSGSRHKHLGPVLHSGGVENWRGIIGRNLWCFRPDVSVRNRIHGPHFLLPAPEDWLTSPAPGWEWIIVFSGGAQGCCLCTHRSTTATQPHPAPLCSVDDSMEEILRKLQKDASGHKHKAIRDACASACGEWTAAPRCRMESGWGLLYTCCLLGDNSPTGLDGVADLTHATRNVEWKI